MLVAGGLLLGFQLFPTGQRCHERGLDLGRATLQPLGFRGIFPVQVRVFERGRNFFLLGLQCGDVRRQPLESRVSLKVSLIRTGALPDDSALLARSVLPSLRDEVTSAKRSAAARAQSS